MAPAPNGGYGHAIVQPPMTASMTTRPGQLPMQAPAFTTKVGTQYVSHQQPDSLSMRNWAQIREDPRSKFKDSYGPDSRVPASRSQHHYRAGADTIGNAQVEQLQLELQQARSEITQLRGALHYAGLALQGVGSWDKLPPELRCHLDAHHRMVDELTNDLRARNEEVLRLQQEGGLKDKAISHHRHVLLEAIGSWAGNGSLLLAWSGWMKLMRQKNREADFEAALLKSKAEMKPFLLKNLHEWADEKDFSYKRRLFDAWLASTVESKLVTAKTKHRIELIGRSMQMWAGGNRQFQLNFCWKGWLDALQMKKQDDREQALRKEHWEVTKKMQKGSIMKSAMAFAQASDCQSRSVVLRMAIRAWREYLTELRAHEALEAEQHASRELVATHKLLSQLFHAWDQVARLHRRERELQKTREGLTAQELQHGKDIGNAKLIRSAALGFASKSTSAEGITLLLVTVLNAWKTDYLETKRERQREEDTKKWRLEFEEQQKQHAANNRNRQIALAFSVAGAADGQANTLLLQVVWNAWLQVYHESHRDKLEITAAQRVFEDDLMKERREKEQLAKEIKDLDSRHHKEQEKRKNLLLWKMESDKSPYEKDGKTLSLYGQFLLRTTWGAWRECIYDTAAETVRLRNQLVEHVPGLLQDMEEALGELEHVPINEDVALKSWMQHQDCCHRCFWFFCCCCRPTKIPLHKQDPRRVGCMRRCFWRCCPCCKPRHKQAIHPEHESSSSGSAITAGSDLEQQAPAPVDIFIARTAARPDRHKWATIFMSCILYFLVSLGSIALNVVGFLLKANAGCQSSPLPWDIYFIVLAAMVGVSSLLLLLLALGSVLIMSSHLSSHGARAPHGARLRTECGIRIIAWSSCFYCLLACFAVAWFIIGILMYTSSEAKECDDAKSWFLMIFISNIVIAFVMNCLLSCIRNCCMSRDDEGDPQRVQLSHNIKQVTTREQQAWRHKNGALLAFQILVTLGAIAANVLMLLADISQTSCGIAPISWLHICIGNIAILVVEMVLRSIWFMGGMLMSNSHLVKASHYATRTKDGDDQTENYRRELALGHGQAERGHGISKCANCFLYLTTVVCLGWSAGGWALWNQTENGCETKELWWPIVFAAMLLYKIIALILQQVQSPLI